MASSKVPHGERFLTIAEQADSDPWRSRLRKALKPRDRQDLVELARENDWNAQPINAILLAWSLQKVDEKAQAVEVLNRAQRRHPSDFWINFDLARALYQSDPKEAAGFYRVALALRPRTYAVHNELGNALLVQNRLTEAETEYREAIALNPAEFYARCGLGATLFKQGKFPEAETEYRAALGLKPDDFSSQFGLGQVLSKQRNLAGAEAAYREAVRLKPDHYPARYALALALLDQNKSAQAEAAFRAAIRVNPKGFWARYNLALCLRSQGRDGEAENVQRELIAVLPDYPEVGHAHNAFGRTLVKQGKYSEAEQAFTEALRRMPTEQTSLVHHSLGDFLANCPDVNFRDPKQALVHAHKAVELGPKDHKHWTTLAVARYRLGDWQGSIEALEKSIIVQPNPREGDARRCFVLAMAHWQLGNHADARKWHDQAVQSMVKRASNNEELRRFQAEAAELLKTEEKSK
jgi:tetratricopeptide (TPR) repeat protein